MSKQEIKIVINELGTLILSTKNEVNSVESIENDYLICDNHIQNRQYSITLNNIVEYDKLDEDTSILCKTKKGYVKKIYLLEETDYILKFKKNKEINESNNFSTLSSLNDIKFDSFNQKDFFLNFKGYVGKTFFDIQTKEFSFKIPIEIRSKKINYEKEYTQMINDLSNITSNLIYNINPSVFQKSKLENHRESDYDYFLLLNYIFADENLPSVYEYLSRNLNKKLETYVETVPVSFASNVGPNEISEILINPQEIMETEKHEFIEYENKHYIPLEIIEEKHQDSIDTPENRFYKYFLELIEDIIITLQKNTNEGYIKDQLTKYKNELNIYLSQQYFKEISKLDYIPLNSQILQKKEGYRDILKYYIMLEYGNKIEWISFKETIQGHQKKLSDIYEIWGCFQLLDILEEIMDENHKEFEFKNKTVQNILDNKNNNLLINLEENTEFKANSYNIDDKEKTVTLMYNKHFRRKFKNYHSYSIYLRPDYTIKLEYNNQTKYVHFDAKYKNRVINNENKDKTFKNQDIAKMHTYQDAIPNTICSYIIYPGKRKKKYKKNRDNYYEGVGAFPLRPGNKRDKKRIKRFIKKILHHY